MYNTDAPKALNIALNEHVASKIMRKLVVAFQIDLDRQSNMHALSNKPMNLGCSLRPLQPLFCS